MLLILTIALSLSAHAESYDFYKAGGSFGNVQPTTERPNPYYQPPQKQVCQYVYYYDAAGTLQVREQCR